MKVGIVGLGYIGLPLPLSFAEAGCDVVGLDVDRARVEQIQSGRSPERDEADKLKSELEEAGGEVETK